MPALASAQSIGAYTPPIQWSERPPRFDLVHQRIAIGVDWSHLAVHGTVTTTVKLITVTDTVRLDADHLTMTGATDAAGRKLRYQADSTHVTVKLPKRGATRRYRHLHADLHRGPRARALLRAAQSRGLEPGRGDRDPELGADLRLPQRQDDLGIPGDRRLGDVGAVERDA